MKHALNASEIELLHSAGIDISSNIDSEDEMFDLLERVHDIEIMYAQDADNDSAAREMANQYALIADKIQSLIPED